MWYERSWQWAKEHLTITVPGVALIFAATFIVMLAVNAGEVGASWVQAVGSIIGIIGAAAFPYMHEATKQKQNQERIRAVLELLARNQQIELGRLIRVLGEAVEDFGENSINAYLNQGWHLKWEPHIEALSAVAIADLDYRQVDMLGDLKVAATFALSVVGRLADWDCIGDRERADIVRLENYHFDCGHIVATISRPFPWN